MHVLPCGPRKVCQIPRCVLLPQESLSGGWPSALPSAPPSFSTAPRKTALVNSVFANCSFGLEHWKWAHTYPSSFADSGSFWLRSPGEVVIQSSNHGTTWGLMSNTFVLSILRLRKRPINKADLLSDQENLFHRFSLNFKLDVQAIMDENVKYPITYEYDLV